MRSLWKGTTEFWTNDMPQDDTWRPNRHHSNVLPLFRNHLSLNAVAMLPPPLNPVVSAEHGCRDSRLPSVPHTEDDEEKGRRVVLWMSELSNVYSSHHHDPSGTTESQDAAAEAADPSSQRQDTSEGMSTPPGQALGKWHGKGKYVSAMRSHHQRQERDHGNQQVDPEEIGDRRGEASFQLDGGGTHRTGLGAGRDRRSQEVAGRGPCGGPKQPRTMQPKQHSGWDRQWRRWHRSENCWRRTRNQPVNEDKAEEAFAGRHQQDKSHVGKMV